MFGLPLATTLLVFAPPLLWVLYTIGFLLVTRHWERQPTEEDDGR